MNRRNFIQIGIASAGAVSAISGKEAMATAKLGNSHQAGATLIEATVADLQAAMSAGKLTAKALTTQYLARIKAIDKSGPRINAIIELNPDALAIAAALDKERKTKGVRGPLHGIPVLLKDNIATFDKMQTTAGSWALVGSQPSRDAFIVTQLREAGAVILGKTNLSEWANIRSSRSTSGWSGRGGLTKNPYALDRNTSGSSSGSGAAIAASLAAVAVGTETDGSIVSPANVNGLVGFKPTLGLVSRNGIIPIAHSQDTAGPMTRTVADAAVLLSVLAGSDARDAATQEANARKVDYTQFLKADGLKGARIGVVRPNITNANDLVASVIEEALKVLTAQGAVLIDPIELPNAGKYGRTEFEVLQYELKADMAAYLAEFVPQSKIKTLQDIIDFNDADRAREMPYFNQETFLLAVKKGGLDSQEYIDALATNLRLSRAEGIDQIMKQHKLDALVAPSGGPAWLTDFIKGDNSGGGFSSAAAVAGYPHITVPAGAVYGLPVGISFVGAAWSEPTLIKLAYSYEQASRQRRAPTFVKTVNPQV